MGRSTKLVRLNRETADQAAALAAKLPGASMGDVLHEALNFHMLAFSSLAEAQKQAGLEVKLDLAAEGLLRGFIDHMAAVGHEAEDREADPTAYAIAVAAGMTPRQVEAFAVQVFARMLTITKAAGHAPRADVAMSPEDVLRRFADAVHTLAFRAEPGDRQRMEIDA